MTTNDCAMCGLPLGVEELPEIIDLTDNDAIQHELESSLFQPTPYAPSSTMRLLLNRLRPDERVESSYASQYTPVTVSSSSSFSMAGSELNLASCRTAHISQSTGWTCGYTNVLMLISSLDNLSIFPTLQRNSAGVLLAGVSDIQAMVHAAWQDGFDAVGAASIGPLLGSRKWLGATEVVTLLRFLSIPARVVDFEGTKFASKTGLVAATTQWIYSYFTTVWPRTAGLYVQDEVFVPPLYMQWQGHSVTVVGIDYNERCPEFSTLLVFDPAESTAMLESALRNDGRIPQSIAVSATSLLSRKAMQFVYVDAEPLTLASRDASRVIVAEPWSFLTAAVVATVSR
jgi:hypothetical protein